MQKTITARGIAYKWVVPIVLSIAVAMLSGFVLGPSVGAPSADTRDNLKFEQMLVQARALTIEENAAAERDEAFQRFQRAITEARKLNSEENSTAERDLVFQNSQRMLTDARALNLEENAAADRDAAFRNQSTK